MTTATCRIEVPFGARVHHAALTLRAFVARLATLAAPASACHRIARGATIRIARPLGRSVACVAGTLWLTFDGEPVDIVLEAGQTHRCAHRSRLLIHAVDAATARID